jgi:phosphoribosylamine--glycine ligase
MDYPSPNITTGSPITGIEDAVDKEGCLVFHAGTAKKGGQLVTAGGRVLNVVGRGPTLEEARQKTYQGVVRIDFKGMDFRPDIAATR